MLKRFLLASSLLILASCSDDNVDEWNAVEVVDASQGLFLPDSLAQSDTLYGWYLIKEMAPGALSSAKAESSSGTPNSSGASSSSAGSCNSGNSSGVSSSSSSVPVETDGDSVYTTEEYADASKLRLLPPAGFYSELTIPVPQPQYGGVIRCTFDGSAPTYVTAEFVAPYTLTRSTAVKRRQLEAKMRKSAKSKQWRILVRFLIICL